MEPLARVISDGVQVNPDAGLARCSAARAWSKRALRHISAETLTNGFQKLTGVRLVRTRFSQWAKEKGMSCLNEPTRSWPHRWSPIAVGWSEAEARQGLVREGSRLRGRLPGQRQSLVQSCFSWCSTGRQRGSHTTPPRKRSVQPESGHGL